MSTLNRLELSRETPTRYRKISRDPTGIGRRFVDLLLEAHVNASTKLGRPSRSLD